MQRIQAEHILRQHSFQELQAQITKSMGVQGAQSVMFLPFLEHIRGLTVPNPAMPPPTSTATTGSKHINSIANVRHCFVIYRNTAMQTSHSQLLFFFSDDE